MPGIKKIGSYPNPLVPRGYEAIFPYHDFCVLNIISPLVLVATIAHVKQHLLFFLLFNLSIISYIPFLFLKKREELTPGFLFNANTSIPESSENAIAFSFFESAEAFL